MKAGTIRRSFLGLLLLLVSSTLPAAQAFLRYQSRGDRHEGVRDRPIAGTRVELIAAMADLPMAQAWPERLQVRFYLGEKEPAYLTVRELDNERFYWLDRVDPEPWQAGFGNLFSWPTGDVLAHLEGLGMSDLGVVARLGSPEGDIEERVAPVLFYAGDPPARIDRYLFVFKIQVSRRITTRLYRPGSTEPGEPEELESRFSKAGRPFTVPLDLSCAPDGDYRLVLAGEGISKIVRFHHRAQVR